VAGIEQVSLETYVLPHFWLAGDEEGACLAPIPFRLRVAAAPYSAATPTGGLETRLVDAGAGTAAEFDKLGASARGAVALVRSEEMHSLDDLFGEYLRNSALVEAASRAGVAALLLQSTRRSGLLYRHPMTLD